MDEIHLIPANNGTNALVDAMDVINGIERYYVLRPDQTVEEFLEEEKASIVRLDLGLSPGRDMPTKEEIEAGPVEMPAVVDKLAVLEERLSVAEQKIHDLISKEKSLIV